MTSIATSLKKTIAAAMLCSVLAGCGVKVDSSTPEKFRTSYGEIAAVLTREKHIEFDTALRKLTAFKVFHPETMDFSRGVTAVNVASVLPPEWQVFQNTAYVQIGKEIDDMSADDVIAYAAKVEEDVVAQYESAVDRGIQSIQTQIDREERLKQQREQVLGSVNFSDAVFKFEGADDAAVPLLEFTVKNGSNDVLHRIDMLVTLLEKAQAARIEKQPVSVDIDSLPLTPGSVRTIRLRLGGQAWMDRGLAALDGRQAEISTFSFLNGEGRLFVAGSPELDRLNALKQSLQDHRGRVAEVIDESFKSVRK